MFLKSSVPSASLEVRSFLLASLMRSDAKLYEAVHDRVADAPHGTLCPPIQGELVAILDGPRSVTRTALLCWRPIK